MAKVLIDNDEEGDDVSGPDRLALAIEELSEIVDQAEEVKRLKAINQELVAALKAIANAEANDPDCLHSTWHDISDYCITLAQVALQHAETRTP
jgi:hypothetical protein